ncbi:hypothetical protein Bca4012_036370 [Brassica carinata]|uniref:Uncharacterized protein n=1 Tax=Brassica carinata TaxID=52824 RepID=A0A8X7WAY5_BRACI|nr:hypothetical protein Bca52824_010091 [Brassica carinata]
MPKNSSAPESQRRGAAIHAFIAWDPFDGERQLITSRSHPNLQITNHEVKKIERLMVRSAWMRSRYSMKLSDDGAKAMKAEMS